MARETILVCALELSIHMARRAGDLCMAPIQRESRLAVIENDVFPTDGVMASRALLPHLLKMNVRMAGGAILWRAGKDIVFMAVYAGNACMLTQQWEA